MNNREDWRQTVISQHQMWATIAGFSVTGIVIFTALGGISFLSQKILLTAILIFLAIQIGLLLIVAETERRTAWQSNIFMQNLENHLRLSLNIITFISWSLIATLLIITIWDV